ncbi:flagellar biosynthesis protein FlgL [Sulfurimonas sp.]|uniref:flagellin N-terminal helical domain-containing protein n=1 Tax=Sulfurimonas sp. TaxID=2022749 RepID=UPI002611F6A7|nr:flagellar biosynthesis protein FlgL [Sulfurimonas sp.]MDD3856046.1 flagellar biosynthesis protein FlgL [Sulfurimonas sp.]
MRVTNSMYYRNIFGKSNSDISQQLFNVNKQIASTSKIQYAQDDVRIFSETMRLDNEITVLSQSKKSSESGYKISNQTDVILNDFEDSLDRMKTLLVQSASASQNDASMDAVAKELRSIEVHLKNLANTSINGQYLFSGSAIDTKPIASDGTYKGNDNALNAFTGSGVVQQYNISGSELFLGEELAQKKEISTNIVNYSLTAKYPELKGENIDAKDEIITSASTIRDLMGDTDDIIDANNAKHHFYVRGTLSDGVAFNKQISMKDDESVDELLSQIGEAYGNTPDLTVVNVKLNSYGQIVIEDKLKGSSKLDFHMVGATDLDYIGFPAVDKADIMNASAYHVAELGKIENLISGESNFGKIMNGTSSAVYPNLHIKNFVQSDFTPANEFENKLVSAEFSMSAPVALGETLSLGIDNGDGTVSTITQAFNIDAATTYNDLKTQIENTGNFSVTVSGDTITLNTTSKGIAKGVAIGSNLTSDNVAVTTSTITSNKTILSDMQNIFYDDTSFSKDGSKLTSNVPQIVKDTNAFATASTKLFEVADITQNNAGTLGGTSLKLSGVSVQGTAFDAQIDLKSTANGGSTFSLDGGVTNYTIFNMENPRTAIDADDMTYQQLMDVMNMVTTSQLPVLPNHAASYDSAIESSNQYAKTYLTYDGKIEFKDMNSTDTHADIALHDANSGNFSTLGAPSVMAFNANNAITTRDPKTDFFKSIDEAIRAVEEHKVYPDGTTGSPRSIGIQEAMQVIDDLNVHVSRIHAKVGAQSNALDVSIQRTEMLQISSITLRSSVIDTDVAESQLMLSQLKLNYEAMLSTVGKISQLSLVNYL